MHVDTVNTHVVSAIINVDQQIDEEVNHQLLLLLILLLLLLLLQQLNLLNLFNYNWIHSMEILLRCFTFSEVILRFIILCPWPFIPINFNVSLDFSAFSPLLCSALLSSLLRLSLILSSPLLSFSPCFLSIPLSSLFFSPLLFFLFFSSLVIASSVFFFSPLYLSRSFCFSMPHLSSLILSPVLFFSLCLFNFHPLLLSSSLVSFFLCFSTPPPRSILSFLHLSMQWPLLILDHDDNEHEVLMRPGDMVLYESAKLLHGRPSKCGLCWMTDTSVISFLFHLKSTITDILSLNQMIWTFHLMLITCDIKKYNWSRSGWYEMTWHVYCIALYCVVLYRTVQYRDVLCCSVLYCTELYCAVSYCTVLYCTV